MKLTTKQLRSLIREEYQHILVEGDRERGDRIELPKEVILKRDAAEAYFDLEQLLKKVEGGWFGSATLRTALALFASGRYRNDATDEAAGRGRLENTTKMDKDEYARAMKMLHNLEVLIDDQRKWDDRIKRG